MATSRNTISELLATERYNPNIVPQLEAYVHEQARTGTYHFEANLTLTKLYQFFPDIAAERADVLGLVFALSLVNWRPPVPEADGSGGLSTFTDALQLSYVVDADVQEREGPISAVIRCIDLLESCSHPPLWSNPGALPAILSDPALTVLDADALRSNLRRSILLSLACTYASAPVSVVLDALGYSPGEAPDFMAFASERAEDIISSVDVAGRKVVFAPVGGSGEGGSVGAVNRRKIVGSDGGGKRIEYLSVVNAMAVARDQ